MRKNELFDKCVSMIERLLRERKLYIRFPYRCKAQHYFFSDKQISSAIIVSMIEGDAGLITQAWGAVFIEPERTLRCTDIHSSFYGENIALGKLYKELETIALKD